MCIRDRLISLNLVLLLYEADSTGAPTQRPKSRFATGLRVVKGVSQLRNHNRKCTDMTRILEYILLEMELSWSGEENMPIRNVWEARGQ